MVDSSKKDPFQGLYEVFLLVFDNSRGKIPLFIYPDDYIKNDKEKMRPINIHTIWWMDMKDQIVMDNVDLEYGEKIYLARKFLTLSKRDKKETQNDNYSFETIILILALPIDIYIFGGELLNQLTINIIKNFEGELYLLIESEIAKEEIIKTSRIKEIMGKGDKIKERIKDIVSVTCKDFFSSVMKKSDTKSIKEQKAFSYLYLKGFDISSISNKEDSEAFSNIRLFDTKINSEKEFILKNVLAISNIKINEISNELEIIVRNNTEEELTNIFVRIIQLKDFFESEIMNHTIDKWFPNEELLFISPILPNINEYILFIKDDNYPFLSKKIDLDISNLNKV